jgi:hypothetical protein
LLPLVDGAKASSFFRLFSWGAESCNGLLIEPFGHLVLTGSDSGSGMSAEVCALPLNRSRDGGDVIGNNSSADIAISGIAPVR